MTKRARQYLAILAAVVAYYLIHEGAHVVAAVLMGTFEGVRFMGLGVQILANTEAMSQLQLGIFSVVGAVATLVCGWALVLLRGRVCKAPSKVLRSCAWYITLAMLLIDPVYLSLLCGLFGGGDMNGIGLLLPQTAARWLFAILGLVNLFAAVRLAYPAYRDSFLKDSD